jgi:hypothetical protein
MEEKLHGTMMFKLAITPLDDGVLLGIEIHTRSGYGPEEYHGAFAGLSAIQTTVATKLGKFFSDIANQAPR